MAQVFISYARENLSFVKRLAKDLQKAGLDVWQDVSSLEGGDPWVERITAAIKESQYVIVVLSPDSVRSKWVGRELLFAEEHSQKIIPLLYRPCEVPINLGDVNYIDVQGANYEKNFDELLRALDVDVKKPSSPIRVEPSNPFVGLSTWLVALIGIVALLTVAAIFWLKGQSPAPATTPAPVLTTPATAGPIHTTKAPTEPTPTKPTPTDTATPTASPTPSPTPTDTPTPTATQTPTTPPSAYTTNPPTIDNYMVIDQWAQERFVTHFPQGNLYYLNDDQYLYLLVDVIEDYTNDLDEYDRSHDDLTIGFDVDKDYKQDLYDVYYKYSGRDVTFQFFMWSAERRGCGVDPTSLATASEGFSSFGYSPDVDRVKHKLWELKIALKDIKGNLGETVYALVFVDSYENRPATHDDSVPKGFGFDGFCTYDKPIEIDLHEKPSDL